MNYLILLFNDFIPGNCFTGKDCFYLFTCKFIYRAVIIYDYCNTVCRNYDRSKFLCFFILQFAGCHSDVADAAHCGSHTGCRITLVDFNFSSGIYFLICFF